jgi:hypothetical protein
MESNRRELTAAQAISGSRGAGLYRAGNRVPSGRTGSPRDFRQRLKSWAPNRPPPSGVVSAKSAR